jgi:hypothetical protein
MSLYEQFHSDINKKFMFDILKNELLKKKIEINNDESNYNQFLTYFPKIFDQDNEDEIEAYNKSLLDETIKHFSEKNQTQKTMTDLEKIIRERDNIYTSINTNDNENNESITSESSVMESIVEYSPPLNTKVDERVVPYTEIDDLNIEPIDEIKEIKEFENVKKIKSNVQYNIVSSKRSNINSSRYNYRISLKKNSIDSRNLHKISKMIIPIEDNFIFEIPVLMLSIPELNCKIHMKQEEVIENKNKCCGVYLPMIDHTINVENVDKITIDIRDITETRYPMNDILKINIVELKENTIEFTCSNINRLNFKVNDNIKIINIQDTSKLEMILNRPFKIKKINKNVIICKLDESYELEIFNDIDMKIMNMSNQNIIYFN